MKVLEITTPELQRAVQHFDAATSGALDVAQARIHLAAGNALVRAVGQKLHVAQEAKLLEQQVESEAKQIESKK